MFDPNKKSDREAMKWHAEVQADQHNPHRKQQMF